MEPQQSYSIYANKYQNIDTTTISTILLKDGTLLQINNKISPNNYRDKSHNRNTSDSSLPVNNLSKVKKFNSFSANTKYKAKFSNQNKNNGFYVTPIINGNKKLIAIKIPDNSQNKEFKKENRHIENITFKVSPKKYIYKPYKPPKRKSNQGETNIKLNYNFYCSNPSFVNKKNK